MSIGTARLPLAPVARHVCTCILMAAGRGGGRGAGYGSAVLKEYTSTLSDPKSQSEKTLMYIITYLGHRQEHGDLLINSAQPGRSDFSSRPLLRQQTHRRAELKTKTRLQSHSPGAELPTDDPSRPAVEDDAVWESLAAGKDVAQERRNTRLGGEMAPESPHRLRVLPRGLIAVRFSCGEI